MKTFFSVLFIFSSWLAGAQGKIDVLHYTFNINLNDNNDTIFGVAVITFMPLEKSTSIDFDLTDATSGKGMKVTQVKYHKDNTLPISFTQANDKLTVTGTFQKGDSTSLIIFYQGIPSDGLIISKNKYGNRTFFADNWPNRGHNWLPCHDDPADKASVEFVVTAPQHYQVVANGIQVEETNLPDAKKLTHWKEEVPISTKVMVIGVADFAVTLSGVIGNCVPVYSWVYPQDREKGFYDYAQAAEILPWFINNVGPYAYKKLANVQSKTTFGGLENANTIFYSEKSVSGTRKSESLLAHEIAHQWFGNYATEKSFAHLWLSEGFATYMTILYLENKYGKDTAIAMLKEDREQAINFGKSNPLPVVNNTQDYMALLNANSYQKGGWVLHMLRCELGDSIFWKSIQLYYSTYGGKTADTDDLRKIFEKVSGKNLEKFFQQWLFTAENPSLKITWKRFPKEEKLSITVEQIQQTLFQFPLELSIVSNNKKNMIKKIAVTKKSETFYFIITSPVLKIEADPNTSLLFNATINEVK